MIERSCVMHSHSRDLPLHPMLPNQIEATINGHENPLWEAVYSDHVPIYSEIPYPENDDVNFKNKIKLITWNVLSQDSDNALAKGDNRSCGENTDKEEGSEFSQQQRRHKRIATSIKKMNSEQRPHLILLQEAGMLNNGNVSTSLLQLIQNELGNDWVMAPNTDGGSVTFYHTEYFDKHEKISNSDKPLYPSGNRLTLKNSNHKLAVYNCHGMYSSSPLAHENHINALLSTGSASEKVIVAGDINVNCIPKDLTIGNIGTAALPSLWNKGTQGIHAIDACYASVLQHSKLFCEIAFTKQLNPLTGKTYTPQELLAPINCLANMEQQYQIKRMRPSINMGESSLLSNGMRLIEYQYKLREKYYPCIFLLPQGAEQPEEVRPRCAYLKKENNKVFVNVTDMKGKLGNKCKEIPNCNVASLMFDSSQHAITIGDELLNQIKKLQPRWNPAVIYARECTNMLNERGICLEIPELLFNYLRETQQSIGEFQRDDNGICLVLFIKDNIEEMNRLIDSFFMREALQKILLSSASTGRIASLERIKKIKCGKDDYLHLLHLDRYQQH